MFDALLKSKFYAKSKSAIKLTKTRIEMIKRKRNAMQKYLKNDVSDLLKNGLDKNAYGRAEGLWNELNLSSCYDSVEQFCVHISSHLANMNKQRECPEECREAVASLMFAAARFADLPELRELRALFTERYGNSIECYANEEFVNKLKATPPTKDMKLQLMQDIASESGIKWNSKALEQKLYNLPAPAQDRAKNGNTEESIPKTMDDAAKEKHSKGAGYKRENPRGFTAHVKKVEDLSSRGRKEITRAESDSPRREKVVAEGKNRSYRSFEGAEDYNHIKDARVDRIHRKEQQKYESPRGFNAPERGVDDLSSRGRKELIGDESNSPGRGEKFVAEVKHRSSQSYEGAEDSNHIKHVRVDRINRKEQQNEPQTVRCASGEDDDKPFYYKPFHPPYTKSRMSNADSSLTVPPTGSDTEVPEHTKTPGHIDREIHLHQGDPNGKVRPLPKSVRRIHLKPQPEIDQEGEKQGRQHRKALDDDSRDEEERKLDWLLRHHSKKRSSARGGLQPDIRPSPQQAVAANDTTRRDMVDTGRDGPPTRTASFPDESSPAKTPRKGYARAASFQAENCHVHPKLLDYDDFVARLAALGGNQNVMQLNLT